MKDYVILIKELILTTATLHQSQFPYGNTQQQCNTSRW